MRTIFFCFLMLTACDRSSVPLDAEARRLVDSLSADQIGRYRRDIDSTCTVQRTTVLPLLIDSIKKVRLQEIAEQLKSVPK